MNGRSSNFASQNDLYKYSGKDRDFEANIQWDYFGARYYDPEIGRWMSVDPLAEEAPDMTPYHYTHNNPLNRVDFDGLSDLRYNRATNTLMLKSSSGKIIGVWDANNNVISTASQFPLGESKFSWYSPHPGLGPNSAFGSYGNFIFEVKDHSGMGVHSGRENTTDLTEGCIRTTDEATKTIKETREGGDPLETIEVVDETLPDQLLVPDVKPLEVNFPKREIDKLINIMSME